MNMEFPYIQDLPDYSSPESSQRVREKQNLTIQRGILCLLFLSLFLTSCSSSGLLLTLSGEWEFRNGFGESWLMNYAPVEWNRIEPGNVPGDPAGEIKHADGIITLRTQLPVQVVDLLKKRESIFIYAGNPGFEARYYLDTTFLGLIRENDFSQTGGLPGFVRSLPFPGPGSGVFTSIYIVCKLKEKDMYNSISSIIRNTRVGDFRNIAFTVFTNLIFSIIFLYIFILMGCYYLTLAIRITNKQQYYFIGAFYIVSAFLGLFYFRLNGFFIPFHEAAGDNIFYLAFFFKEPLFLLFFLRFYKIKMNKIFLGWIIFNCITALIMVFIDNAFIHFIKYIGYAGCLIVYGRLLHISVNKIRKNAGEALYITSGILLMIICNVYIILSYEGFIGKNPGFYFAYFITLSLFSLSLTRQFVRVNALVEGMNIELEKRVEEKTKNLEETHSRFIEIAHSAGMAEVATSILHNLGNVLNSIYVSSEEIIETLTGSKLAKMLEAGKLLEGFRGNIADFLANDPKAPLLFAYFLKVGDNLKEEHEKVIEEAKQLIRDITMIKEIIDTQQEYAKQELPGNELNLLDIVEDALKMQSNELKQAGVTVDKKYLETPNIKGQKSKIIHILINLFKNAMTAMQQNKSGSRVLTIGIGQNSRYNVYVTIGDNGSGISRENLHKLFSYGFTTKKDGHGFGLHICAGMMHAMGGIIEAENKGDGKGAVFTLTFPLENSKVEEGEKKRKP